MRLSRMLSALAMVGLLLLVLAFLRHPSNEPAHALAGRSKEGPRPHPAQKAAPAAPSAEAFGPASAQSPASAEPRAGTFLASGQIREEIRLSGNPLRLSDREIDTIERLASEVYLKRLRHETQIDRIARNGPDRVVIHIPEYRETGRQLRAEFDRQLADALGEARARDVERSFGALLTNLNQGFGEYPQDVVITRLPDGYYDISHRQIAPDGTPLATTNSQFPANGLDAYAVFAAQVPPSSLRTPEVTP